jgi:DNA adenine methylase
MEEWYRQRKIQEQPQKTTLLTLGFSTFFLNRTNRSGIISGGVIGGKRQSGEWKLDCRFNKSELIERIRKVAQYKRQISIYNKDASVFIRTVLPKIHGEALVYFDPPYYVKGQQALYVNYYEPDDHKVIAKLISKLKQNWIVSYDDVPEIRSLYKKYDSLSYRLHYTVQNKYQGKEILFFSRNLAVPEIENPQKIKAPKLVPSAAM